MAKPTLQDFEMLRTKYGNMWDVEFQQVRSNFEGHAEIVPDVEGERYEWPIHGGTEMTEYDGYNVDLVDSSLGYDKRSLRYRKFYNSQFLSKDVQRDMKPLDMSFARIKTEQAKAAKRKWDEIFLGVVKDKTTGLYRLKTDADGGYLGGILGTNYKGDGGIDKVNLDLSYGGANLIPVDWASTGTGVSKNLAGTFIDRLIYLKAMLETKEVFDAAMPYSICVAISPAVKRELLTYELTQNRDYGFSALGEAGQVAVCSKMGVTFIVSNMLPKMDTEDKTGKVITGARMCCAWLKNRVGVGIAESPTWEMRTVDKKVDVTHRIVVTGAMGAARRDEDTTFVLPCIENLG